jgi:hypothetical protein
MAKRLSEAMVTTNGNGYKPQVSAADALPVPLEESIFVELSTGRIVEMVIGELSMFYELGRIPDELKSIAAKILFSAGKDDLKEVEKRYFERLKVAKWTVMEVLRNNTVPLTRFYHDEIWEIYSYANDPASAMASFRRLQAKHVGVVSGLQDVGAQTEPEDATAEALA